MQTWRYHDVLWFIMDSSSSSSPWMKMDRSKRSLWLFSALNTISVWWNEVWSHFILADLISSIILGGSFIAQETERQAWNSVLLSLQKSELSLRFLLKTFSETFITPIRNHHLHDNYIALETTRYLLKCMNLWVGESLINEVISKAHGR